MNTPPAVLVSCGGEPDADQAWSIERHAVEPIPATDRHGSPGELFRLWIGANVNYLVLITGTLTVARGLSMAGSITAIVIGNLLGCTVVGLASILGPRTGTAGIITSRSSFGQLGAVLPIFISTIAAVGWFSINSVIATESLAKLLTMTGLPDSPLAGGAAMLVVLTAEILLAIYGHALDLYERGLGYIVIWTSPWICIVVIDFFCVAGPMTAPT